MFRRPLNDRRRLSSILRGPAHADGHAIFGSGDLHVVGEPGDHREPDPRGQAPVGRTALSRGRTASTTGRGTTGRGTTGRGTTGRGTTGHLSAGRGRTA